MKVTTKAYVKSVINLALAILGLFIFLKIVPGVVSFFMPFAIAGIIAVIASPMVRFLEKKWNIRRKWGTALIVILTIAVLIVVGYAIGRFLTIQVSELLASIPKMWKTYLTEFLTGNKTYSMEWLGNMMEGFPGVLIAVIMGFLASYFFVVEQECLYNFYEDYIPEGAQKYCSLIRKSLTDSVSGYFKAQLKIEGWMYLILVIGLWILGISYAPLLAFLIALVDLLPIFGAGTVLCPMALFALIKNDYKASIGLLVIWLVTLAVRQIIQPKIVGDTIGLPSIPTLLLLYMGYKLAGVLGMIIAVPSGIIFWNLYQAGVFDTITNSFRILCAGFNQFRHLTAEDIQIAYPKNSADKNNRS